jgi:hypothetical protein
MTRTRFDRRLPARRRQILAPDRRGMAGWGRLSSGRRLPSRSTPPIARSTDVVAALADRFAQDRAVHFEAGHDLAPDRLAQE